LDTRPVIDLTANLHLSVDASSLALCGHGNVFQRAGALVHVIRQSGGKQPKGGIERAPGSPVIDALGEATARTMLSRRARYQRYDRREKKWLPTVPPRDIAEAVLGLRNYPEARQLEGVIEAPTLRPDGSLISRPGYDEATGLLYVPSAEYPEIPDAPDWEDARAAMARLLYVVSDFPFEKPSDRMAWASLVISVVARGGIAGPVPGYLITANLAGPGKTLLADLAGLIPTGRPPAVDGYVLDDVEMDKRLTSIAVAGDRCVIFDNARSGSSVGCPSLDRALTARGAYRGRILGSIKMSPSIPWYTTVIVTGNNLTTQDDALRRFVPIFLFCEEDKPEERRPEEFRVFKDHGLSLRAYVERERPNLVAAALTVVRAYVAAGRPRPRKDLTPMDFPEWDALVRQAVYYATTTGDGDDDEGIDPCGSRERLVADDDTSSERVRLVEAWSMLCEAMEKSEGVTTGEAANYLRDQERTIVIGRNLALIEAFTPFASRGTVVPDSRTLGYVLKRHKGAPTAAGRVASNANRTGAQVWFVKPPTR
jgi:hypothetical protein